ncbi:hypothetical protein LCGC14_3104480 [marine sediment metagenome]|uniref:Uncharacterized protein n=1 Tax=marine sediment metagenome TaxID=412755 RepID=A0A0F8W6V0_9ZZZZ
MTYLLLALLYGLVVLLIARRYAHAGTHEGTYPPAVVTDADTGEVLKGRPLTPHEQLLWEERVAPYRDALTGNYIHPHSPAHYYQAQVGTKRTYRDINMDDPDWVRALEDEL